jgi:hypothetical protein
VTTTAGEYLVQYGRLAFVGRFAAVDGKYARGDRVVIRSPRGIEYGTVLCEPAAKFAALIGSTADGDLIRPAGTDDLSRLERLEDLGTALLAAADKVAAAANLPVTLLDAEVLHDGTSAVLHAAPWGDADLTPLLDAISRDLGLTVRLHDAARTPVTKDLPEPEGCGKPGCGSESGGCTSCGTGGGCSTGSCSAGAVKSADELTSYFADLRRQMEAHFGGHRTPLN